MSEQTAAAEGERWVEYVPLDQLRPNPANPKAHSIEALRESMTRFQFTEPPQVDERTGLLIAGHGRRELLLDDFAAGREPPEGVRVAADGRWLVPVVRGWSSTDDDAAWAYLVAANRVGEVGGWQRDLLADGLQRLAAMDSGVGLVGTGYSADDLESLLSELAPPPEPPVALTDPDAVPEPPETPITKPGDLWLLGEHRLLCGDATKATEVERLLEGDRADLIVTDPPYGVSHGSGITDAKAIRGDVGQAVIPIGFAVMLDALADDGRLYVFGGSGQFAMYLGLWDHYLHDLPRVIVWVKESFVLRQIAYHSQYELIYWGWKGSGGGSQFWYGDRHWSDVWRVARDRSGDHPTQKPVELLRIPIENSSAPGAIVLDPFGGSGSTLIACHLSGRRARLLEIDPHYCDVVCRRWQEVSGQVPVLAASGGPVSFALASEPV